MAVNIDSIDRTNGYSIGLCYLDPETESLLEIKEDSGYMLNTDAHKATIHKIYIVTGQEHNVDQIRVRPVRTDELEKLFDIKIASGQIRPSILSFDELPEYNTLEINQLVYPNSIIPVYIYIRAKADITKLSGLNIEVQYVG